MRRLTATGGGGRGALVAAIGLAVLASACGRQPTDSDPALTATEIGATSEASSSIDLYFPSERGQLRRESREFPAAGSAAERIRQLVEALLAGPDGDGLFAPLPAEVRLAAVHLTPAGIAYIDLEIAGDWETLSMGSRGELLTVYSIVDSVVLNVGEVEAVVLLWNGRQRFSFAGHVDTAGPLAANLDLVAGE